jgi:hypothetical protein
MSYLVNSQNRAEVMQRFDDNRKLQESGQSNAIETGEARAALLREGDVSCQKLNSLKSIVAMSVPQIRVPNSGGTANAFRAPTSLNGFAHS